MIVNFSEKVKSRFGNQIAPSLKDCSLMAEAAAQTDLACHQSSLVKCKKKKLMH